MSHKSEYMTSAASLLFRARSDMAGAVSEGLSFGRTHPFSISHNSRMKLSVLLFTTATASFAALPSVGPDYARPTTTAPAAYRDVENSGSMENRYAR